MQLDAAIAAGAIGDRQRAPEIVGDDRALQLRKDLHGVAIGDRQRRDFHDGDGVLAVDPLGALHRAIARRTGVAGIGRHVGDRAALHTGIGAAAAIGVGIGGGIAIIRRIGIDQRTDGALFLCQFRLQAAPAAAIAGERDLALHADAAPRQRRIIGGQAIVHINHIGGDIAVALEGDIGRQRVLEIGARRVLGDRRLLPAKRHGNRADKVELRLQGRRVKHLEGLDLRIPAPGFELAEDELGIGLVMRAADMVGRRCHLLEPAHLLARRHAGIEYSLALGLFGRHLRHGQRRTGQQCGQRNRTECHEICPHDVVPVHRCTDGCPTGRGGKRFFGVRNGAGAAMACGWRSLGMRLAIGEAGITG